jgi:hypothetical protein
MMSRFASRTERRLRKLETDTRKCPSYRNMTDEELNRRIFEKTRDLLDAYGSIEALERSLRAEGECEDLISVLKEAAQCSSLDEWMAAQRAAP